MTINAAQIENGIVTNVLVVESLDFLPNLVEIAEGFGIGDLYADGQFSRKPDPEPEPVPIPKSVTMRQARLALLNAGLLSQVDAALAGIPDETQKAAAQIEWEYATEVVRSSQLVTTLAAALGLSDQQLDSLFESAALL